MAVENQQDATLHLPRILCLHGGGTNSRIFSSQCRVLRKQLESSFRLCFAEAPFPSEAGSDVVRVYKGFQPFRRWLRWLPTHPPIQTDVALEEINKSLHAAMRTDDAKGATGDWVALLGFSQGAKMAASLLLRQQIRTKKFGKHMAGTNFRFAILIAGRGPLVHMEPGLPMTTALMDASQNSLMGIPKEFTPLSRQHVISIPTIHVHGLRDPDVDLHKQLLERYFEKESTVLISWDGDHRVPIKSMDVAAVVNGVFSVARKTGVL